MVEGVVTLNGQEYIGG